MTVEYPRAPTASPLRTPGLSLARTDSKQNTRPLCDQHPRHQRAGTVNETAEPMDSTRNSALCAANGLTRASTLQKLNPFSVESLLADSSPRRKTILDFSQLPPQRPLVGKGHFLLYPITQPLGFIVPQTAMKLGQDSGISGHSCSATDISNQKNISHLCKDTGATDDELQRESKNSSMKTSNTSSEKCYAESNSPQKEFENDPECTVTDSSQKASISPNLSEYSDTKPRSSADTNTDGEDVDMD